MIVPMDVADFKIHCEHYDSITALSWIKTPGTAFGVVKAHATNRIPNVNMGFLNPANR